MSLSIIEFTVLAIYLCHLIGLFVFIQYIEELRLERSKQVALEEQEQEQETGSEDVQENTSGEEQEQEEDSEEEEEEEEKPFTMNENPMFIHHEENIAKED